MLKIVFGYKPDLLLSAFNARLTAGISLLLDSCEARADKSKGDAEASTAYDPLRTLTIAAKLLG